MLWASLASQNKIIIFHIRIYRKTTRICTGDMRDRPAFRNRLAPMNIIIITVVSRRSSSGRRYKAKRIEICYKSGAVLFLS